MRYRYVEVQWWDAHSVSAWVTEETLPKPVLVVSKGYLIKDTPKYLTLVSSYIKPENANEEPYEFGEALTIPRGWLESERDIEVESG